jgi:predicted glycogen debranching enzyme
MMTLQDKTILENFSVTSGLEWLETNGLGGWAGSSLTCCNTRRYHGLLMAATDPPAGRMLLVSKMDESVLQNGKAYELGTNDYGDAISPTGYQYLSSFVKDIFPEWIFECPGIRLQKTITMVHEENTSLIRYEVLKSGGMFTMHLRPFIAGRGYHQLQHENSFINRNVNFENGLFHNQPYEGLPGIFISVPGSRWQTVDQWYYKFSYSQEKYRGLDFEEDLFNHGYFMVDLKEGDRLHIIISNENPSGKNPEALWEQEKARKLSLSSGITKGLLTQLTRAADQFIVKRTAATGSAGGTVALKTIIAGYHWFTDWGRDTMISLPGLCLETGRADDAKKILDIFGKSVSMGMLPNRFMDNKEPPEYNNVDGTLWFFNAAYCYLQKTGDRRFILDTILPILKNIMEWHFRGTRFNIHLDNDGLLYAGEKGQQLTWMDAKVGDWVVTPRMGKPVEIQALWYNALRVFEEFLILQGDESEAGRIQSKADQAKKSFEEKFWHDKGGYLYDNLDENGKPDESLRPNQIFAISLPFQILEGERAKKVLGVVRDKLYTPTGLRSLSPDDHRYIGIYGGPQLERDGAYHQGTVWSWLLGPFMEACMKILGESFRPEALEMIDRFQFHLNEGCIGTVSEIFDGDAPHHPRGCVAQAWGVAEILRIIKKYSLIHAAG